MYEYKRISGPPTPKAAREHAYDLASKFVLDEFLLADVKWRAGHTSIELVSARWHESDDEDERGEHATMTDVMVSLMRWHQEIGNEVMSIERLRRR